MQARSLTVLGAFEFTPKVFSDARGEFVTPYQEKYFVEAVGHPLATAQTNHSRSRRGTVRGLHFADVPPGQGKHVYCPRGAMLDVVVDIRLGSPTFGRWDATRLDTVDFRAVYVPEGVAHGFLALEDDTVISYLCSTPFNPNVEHAINPLDRTLELPWPAGLEPLLSEKDAAAPTLAEAEEAGLLPVYADCLKRYEQLRASAPAGDAATAGNGRHREPERGRSVASR